MSLSNPINNNSETPTVSFNVADPKDYGTSFPFIDIMKSMRPWVGGKHGEWGGYSYTDLKEGGYLDDQGWLAKMPDDMSALRGIFSINSNSSHVDYMTGRYILRYEGEGSIEMSGVDIVAQSPGEIVFDLQSGGNKWFNITATDPNGNGDYIRDISIVKEENVDLFEAGAIFNPDYLQLAGDAKSLRFMGWMGANNSSVSSWEENTPIDNYTWATGSVPIEVIIRLANEAGADPWVTIPHKADDLYVEELATYIRDNLDPRLSVKVEYSNEMWNWSFGQTSWAHAQAQDTWGDGSNLDWQVYRAVQVAKIFEDVFTINANAYANVIDVIGAQTYNAGVANRLLTAPVWQEHDPDGWIDPSTVFEELAITTYFGQDVISSPSLRDEFLQVIKRGDEDPLDWLAKRYDDPSTDPLVRLEDALRQHAEISEKYGLKLTAYEGGQHVLHSAFINGITAEESSLLTKSLNDFVRSDKMGEIYARAWHLWETYGDDAFMQFQDVAPASRFGSWGILEDYGDSTPRSEFLLSQMATAAPWWEGADSNVAYLRGVSNSGSILDDIMVGTDEEDFFAGGDGNDIFVPMAGSDGINGGKDYDTVIFGSVDQIGPLKINRSDDGWNVFAVGIETRLVNIEAVTRNYLESDDLSYINAARSLEGSSAMEKDDLSIGTHGVSVDFEGRGLATFDQIDTGVYVFGIRENSYLGKALGVSPVDSVSGYHVALANALEASSGIIYGASHFFSQNTSASLNTSIEALGEVIGVASEIGTIVLDPAGIRMTDGDDTFIGSESSGLIYSGGGNDFLNSRIGNDSIFGEAGNDSIHAGRGNDVIDGGDGFDKLFGSSGDDVLNGGSKGDLLMGGSGDDTLQGGIGVDKLDGGSGDDWLEGGLYNDILIGGTGNDVMIGGWGSDVFVYRPGDGMDLISDFTDGKDRIDFRSWGFENLIDLRSKFAVANTTNGVEFDFGAGDILLVNGVTLESLSFPDFLF